MQIIDAAAVIAASPPRALVSALECMFRDGCTAPVRHHHTVPVPGGPDATLLLMPAWHAGRYLAIKVATIFPGNSARNLPAVAAQVILIDGDTGTVLAMIDGGELTARRTVATSALAARYLARPDASSLLVVGTGRIARHLALFHTALRPQLRIVRIWGRNAEHAAALADDLGRGGIDASVALDLAAAAGQSDIVCSATLAREPLIRGDWIRPGTHVDLVGGFTPEMREADDALMAKSRVFGDTREGVLHEAGDVLSPVKSGVLTENAVHELSELCRGTHPGRRREEEITVFKSVGAALEDLAAAILVYESAANRRPAGA
ncbi:MAG TPA: ornithine cyclodeaminase family protein [Steroidobacteraceae bacterium]|jgi:ornithine cyclodeaminase|nr:ornithine cyclodeaminase family protein [Steroidobacteraceae bacterium]